jgi:hypothetical protein
LKNLGITEKEAGLIKTSSDCTTKSESKMDAFTCKEKEKWP